MANDFDMIVVGGGVAGATLAMSLAAKGARVLVLERERTFRDRVRGELVQPWGVAETRLLGIYNLLKQTCGYEVRLRLNQIYGAPPAQPRDLVETTPHRAGSLHFLHPEMQEAVLGACAQAGATVQRGFRAARVMPGSIPSVSAEIAEGERVYRGRLIVGADGRGSSCRKCAAFPTEGDPDGMVIAGVLLTELSAPEDMVQVFINPSRGEVAFLIPIGRGRFRCYAAFYPGEGQQRLSGAEAMPDFVSRCVSAGCVPDWFANAKGAGPLATFNCAETWVPHPYRAGVALVGDAAATGDPVFGCGLSLSLRDARVLSGLLADESNWDAAAHVYAEEHDRYFGNLHRLLGWMVQLFYKRGPEAAARRKHAFARAAEDPSRIPDIAGLGPDGPHDEAAYYNLFGQG